MGESDNGLLASSGVPTYSPEQTPQVTAVQFNGIYVDSDEDYADEFEDEDYEDYEALVIEDPVYGTSLGKVQPVIKPRSRGEKKIAHPKKARSKGKKNNRRKRGKQKLNDLCKTVYKNYCIHGKCKFLKELNKTSCICLPGYQNERCGIQVLSVGTSKERIDGLTIALLLVGAMLTLAAIIVAVTVIFQCKKKLRDAREVESEEKQKLGEINRMV
ncbi:proheparin-binding EGF-like growth factor isoform X2 [Callorhinchus milii]|nr:proheparin-binding EGF-like growth factor isoform X2 [Callorhinchus milii]|eukprot:gi/632949457/ref/XP_007890167.1/ PREDICTED: proheparin-binding EGF-like growth factor isoform X2 [Callorhinchus milii]